MFYSHLVTWESRYRVPGVTLDKMDQFIGYWLKFINLQ